MNTPILRGAEGDDTGGVELIKESTTSDFTADVIEASLQSLILVDFWAPWCGPCKQLTPVLEKLVKQSGGTVRLVKINIDENPQIASQLGVQSIPAVFAFKEGRPVDGFMGALPESQLKTFIERLVGGELTGGMEEVLETAKELFDGGDFQGAAEVYAAVLGEDETHIEAIAGLAQCYISVGDLDQAEAVLAKTPEGSKESNLIKAAEAAIALAQKGTVSSADLSEYETALTQDPNNHQARFDLALALNNSGQKQEAMDALFEIMTRNRGWNDNAAQTQLLELFAAWGPSDELTVEGRRRLSSLLFA